MTKYKRIVLIPSLILGLLSTPAWATTISILGGVNQSLNDTVTEPTTGATLAPAMGMQGGLELGFGLSPMLRLDVGALYLSLKTKVTLLGVDTTTSVNYLDIPVLFRLKLGSMLSLGAGGFYDLAMTSGAEGNYGYLGSLRISFGTGPTAFFIDGRYAGGLKDFGGEKTKGWEAMAGVSFGAGK